MMVETAKIVSVLGRVKTWRGRAIKLIGEVEDVGQVEMTVWRHESPCGVIDPHLIGVEVSVILERPGEATVIPFHNQGPSTHAALISKLIRKADEQGSALLEDLPVVPRRWPRGEKPTPHSMAETLNQLLEQVPEEEEDEII